MKKAKRMWQDVFTVISNLAFIIPIAKAWELGQLLDIFVYMCQMIFSSGYHTCNSFSGWCFGLPPLTLRTLDFFFAQWIIVLSTIKLIMLPTGPGWAYVIPAIKVTAGLVIFLLQRWIGESTFLQFGIAAAALGGLIIYWIGYGIYRWLERDRDGPLFPPYRWKYLTYGLSLSGMASSLYVTEMQNHLLYWAIHSVWHVAAALGQYFLQLAWKKEVIINPKRKILLNQIPVAVPKTGGRGWRYRIVHTTPPSRV